MKINLDDGILVALSFYGSGSYQRIIGRSNGTVMSQQSVSKAIREVTEALNHRDILKKYIKFPQCVEERNAIKRKFYEKFHIPSVVGCIDGTHVAIIRPIEHEERYFNRKHYHSRNVQIMPPNLSENLLPETIPRKLEKTKSLESCASSTSQQNSCDEVSYGIGDAVFSCFVVAPQVVSVWRGTWGVMELQPYLFPFAQIYLLGIVIHICFAIVRTRLLSRSEGAWSKPDGGIVSWVRERLLTRVYAYIFILSNIMHWRGGWGLLDMFVDTILPDVKDPHRPVLIASLTLAFYLAITILRSSRNLLASPYFLVTDGKEPTYIFTTRFKISNSRETMLYILDCIFSVTVVGSLVVFVWRGSWALLDIFLFPDDRSKSCWTSLIVGYAVVIVTFALQAPVRWAAARLHGAPRLLLADVYHLVSFVATVNVWRGVWGLLDIYFFPETPKLSNWSSHIVSLTLLILLNCSNSVIVRGVYIDAEEPAGECVVFPCHYLRLFFHKERTKKRHRRALQAAAAAARRPEEASLPLQLPEEKV